MSRDNGSRGTGRRKDNGYAPLTKVAGMWQHTSKKGATYFVGRIGDAKVLLLENPDWREGGSESSHNLCLSHAPRPRQGGGDRQQQQRDGQQQQQQRQQRDGRQQQQRDATGRPPPPDDSDRF